MFTSHDVLWEDLGLVDRKARQAVEMLQTMIKHVSEGQSDSPTRRDSQRLTRLMVIADLLCNELSAWVDERGQDDVHVAARSTARANGNGKSAH